MLIPPAQAYPASLGPCLYGGRVIFWLLSTVKIDIGQKPTLLWSGCKECCRTRKLHREAPEHQKCCFVPNSLSLVRDNTWAGAKEAEMCLAAISPAFEKHPFFSKAPASSGTKMCFSSSEIIPTPCFCLSPVRDWMSCCGKQTRVPVDVCWSGRFSENSQGLPCGQ